MVVSAGDQVRLDAKLFGELEFVRRERVIVRALVPQARCLHVDSSRFPINSSRHLEKPFQRVLHTVWHNLTAIFYRRPMYMWKQPGYGLKIKQVLEKA